MTTLERCKAHDEHVRQWAEATAPAISTAFLAPMLRRTERLLKTHGVTLTYSADQQVIAWTRA